MERNKYPYLNIGKQKETKNIRLNLKDNSSYTSDSTSSETKNNQTNSNKDKLIKDIRKNLAKNDALKPSQSCTELNSHPTDKKAGLNSKKNTASFIEEKRIKYIPNKSKNRSMEKVPSATIESNKKDWKRNKNNGDKHNSCGKNSNYNKYNKTDTKKNIRINKRNFNTLDYNNIDDLQNININEEQSIKNRNKNKKNNYLNYIINDSKVNTDPNLITKSDLDDTEDENPYSFQEYNSFCVRINNNYNYNVSLGNNSDFMNQTFDNKKDDIQIKKKGKESEWKEKITKINKQKNDINYGDYKKANSKDINSKKTKKLGNKEEKSSTNKSIDSNNTSLNLKQKIKKLNSAVIPGENDKKTDPNAPGDKKNEPKKYTGILGFLRSFKDMVKPFNMRKKTNYESDSDSSNNNSIESSSKTEIKEKANKSENNTILNENKKKRNIFNFLNANENISNTNKKPENNKANVYEKKSLSKKPEDYNYYSDSGYESSPLPHKPKNLNMYSTPNINIAKHKNIYESKNSQQISSYSQKNILNLNNNNNENELKEGRRNRQNSDIVDSNYNDYKTEEKPKGNNLFNLYGIFNNKLYQKTSPNQNNKTNNIINDFYRNNINIPKQINDTGYNSAYVKKTKQIFPPISNNNDVNSEKEIRKYSFHNNNTAYNLNNIDKKNVNSPAINEVNDPNKYNTKNINENLNINAEKKIQEIKININYKRDNNNFNNTLTPVKNTKTNYNNQINNNYDNIDDFIATPKTKSEIETCVINFKQNKKPIKVYENNLINNTDTKINNQNIMNNTNYNLYKNNTNIKDINNSNSKNIYSKPMGKNLNFSQANSLSEKNIMEGKKENILSYSDTNIAINRNNFDSPKTSLKKNIIHQNERVVNRLANSQKFDNDTNSVNSNSSKDLNKTTIFPSSNITNSIYFKPFKYFFGGNKNKTNNSANNSFNNTLFKKDNISDGNLSDRESSANSGLNKIIYFNKKNKTGQLNKNENNVNQNNKLNSEQIIYRKSNSNKNNNFKINLLNSNNNNNVIAINNITPMPDNKNSIVNNIKTIIRPKIIQKKTEFIEKYYSYYIKIPNIEKEAYYFSKEFNKIKIFKMPLKTISFYTKSYYKIIQKPQISQHYIDKKRITHKKAISLPITQECIFTKENITKKSLNQSYDNKFSTPNQKKEIREQNMTPKFMHSNQNNSSNKKKNKIISIEIDLNNKNKYVKKNKDANNEENANVTQNLGSTFNKIHLNTNANEPLYIKKTPNNNVFKQSSKNNNSNNVNDYYVHTEDDNFKIYLKERMNDNLKINKFFSDDFNINNNSNRPTNNKIISIDIDLRKEQKKLQEQKEIKTYKKPITFKPLIEQNQNLKNKINTIKINLNKNSPKTFIKNTNISNFNINDKYINNLNIDKLRQEIIYKLDIIEENNLMIVMDELIDLLTKKVIVNNLNDNINLSKIRLSFIEIINNSYLFVEIIINKAISETKKVDIYAHICYEMSKRMNNEVSFGGNGTNEDLKTILQESCKIKFEEIILKDINIEDNKNNLLGIIMFICELINYKIIYLDTGFLCFEKLCNKYNDSLYENGKLNKYYYLDLIINLLNKIGKNIYQIKDLKYKEKIDNYINNELNNLINNDMGLPEYLRNKIINLIKTKKNNWNF